MANQTLDLVKRKTWERISDILMIRFVESESDEDFEGEEFETHCFEILNVLNNEVHDAFFQLKPKPRYSCNPWAHLFENETPLDCDFDKAKAVEISFEAYIKGLIHS
jgi:hypothetical protein